MSETEEASVPSMTLKKAEDKLAMVGKLKTISGSRHFPGIDLDSIVLILFARRLLHPVAKKS